MNESILGVDHQGGLSLRMGRSIAEALCDAPDYKAILLGRNNRIYALSWFFGTFASRLSMQYGKIFSIDNGQGGILTFSPNQSPSLFSLIGAGVLSLPHYFGVRGAWRAFKVGMHLERRRLAQAPKSHWYVLALGVAPTQQGQGYGQALLTEVMQRADSDGIPCYLEVFEEHLVELYKRKGFDVLQKDSLPYGLTLWCMLRPAPELA